MYTKIFGVYDEVSEGNPSEKFLSSCYLLRNADIFNLNMECQQLKFQRSLRFGLGLYMIGMHFNPTLPYSVLS